jgi:hypothetical protein
MLTGLESRASHILGKGSTVQVIHLTFLLGFFFFFTFLRGIIFVSHFFNYCLLIVQRDFILIFPYVYTSYFDQIHPLYYTLSPVSEQLLMGFIILFSYMLIKYPCNICPPFFTLSPPVGFYPNSSPCFILISFSFLGFGLDYTHDRKHAIFVFLSLGYFT